MWKKEIYYNEIYDYITAMDEIVNTHSHYSADLFDSDLSLRDLLQMTYISWSYPFFEDTKEEREKYINKMFTNSYFTWMAKSLGVLYGDGSALNADNWDEIDTNFRKSNLNPDHSMDILKNKCKYKSIILDKYNNPGSNEGHGDIMTPTFRCDSFLHGYEIDGHDSNNVYPYKLLEIDKQPDSLSHYISLIREKIRKMQKSGCVSLKIAIAYERDIEFTNNDEDKAKKAFDSNLLNTDEIKDFQDYVMFSICKIAAEFKMPIQIHTGLGKLEKSNAMGLKKLIEQNPDTSFVLFHCGYPWMDDVLGLLHNYRNVYPDLCWLPLISTSAAIRFIREALEVGDSSRLCWGCDTWSAQESFGALLSIRHCLSEALSQMCYEYIIDLNQAKIIVKNILSKNAEKLYFEGK